MGLLPKTQIQIVAVINETSHNIAVESTDFNGTELLPPHGITSRKKKDNSIPPGQTGNTGSMYIPQFDDDTLDYFTDHHITISTVGSDESLTPIQYIWHSARDSVYHIYSNSRVPNSNTDGKQLDNGDGSEDDIKFAYALTVHSDHSVSLLKLNDPDQISDLSQSTLDDHMEKIKALVPAFTGYLSSQGGSEALSAIKDAGSSLGSNDYVENMLSSSSFADVDPSSYGPEVCISFGAEITAAYIVGIDFSVGGVFQVYPTPVDSGVLLSLGGMVGNQIGFSFDACLGVWFMGLSSLPGFTIGGSGSITIETDDGDYDVAVAIYFTVSNGAFVFQGFTLGAGVSASPDGSSALSVELVMGWSWVVA